MHALSCGSSIEESTSKSRLATRTRERLVRLSIYDRSTGRCCACLGSDCCKEPSDRFSLDPFDLGRGEYQPDKEASIGFPFRR